MIKKIFYIFAGLLLISSVIFLGFKSTTNPSLVIWFGLSSTFLAPIGLSMFSAVLNIKRNYLINKLLKVPQIEELIQKAETQEEKLTLLQEERRNISNIVRYETLKHAALERRKYLLEQAKNTLDDLEAIDKEIQTLEVEVNQGVAHEEIDKLYAHIKNEYKHNPGLLVFSMTNSLPVLDLYRFIYNKLLKNKNKNNLDK